MGNFKYNPFTNNLDYVGSGSGPSSTDLYECHYIVNQDANLGGNYTTIQAALDAVVSDGGSFGHDIFLFPGTYFEDLTFADGGGRYNLIAWPGDETQTNVLIGGSHTIDASTQVRFNNLWIQELSGVCMSVPNDGCTVVFDNCLIRSSNTGFINVTGNGNSITFNECLISVSSSTYFVNMTGSNLLFCYGCNSQDTSAVNNISGSSFVNLYNMNFSGLTPFSISNSVVFNAVNISKGFNFVNAGSPFLATTSSFPATLTNCHLASDTTEIITIGGSSRVVLIDAILDSTFTSCISGSGNLVYNPITFPNTCKVVTVDNQIPILMGPVTSLSPGSMLVPSLNFGDDATGFYKFATDSFAATCNGNDVLRFLNGAMLIPVPFIHFSGVRETMNVQSANYVLTINDMNVGFHTASGAFSATLPANPSDGQTFSICDLDANALVNPIVIQGNGHNIVATTSNTTLAIATNGGSFTLKYFETPAIWKVIN